MSKFPSYLWLCFDSNLYTHYFVKVLLFYTSSYYLLHVMMMLVHYSIMVEAGEEYLNLKRKSTSENNGSYAGKA